MICRASIPDLEMRISRANWPMHRPLHFGQYPEVRLLIGYMQYAPRKRPVRRANKYVALCANGRENSERIAHLAGDYLHEQVRRRPGV